MAIDTRSKRASVLGVGLAVTLALPLADGSVDQPDRQHVAFTYAGLEAASALSATADVVIAVRADVATIRCRPDPDVIAPGPDIGTVEVA